MDVVHCKNIGHTKPTHSTESSLLYVQHDSKSSHNEFFHNHDVLPCGVLGPIVLDKSSTLHCVH